MMTASFGRTSSLLREGCRTQAVTFEITFDACLSAGAVTTEKKW
jgi:hypothetical protein